MSKTQRDLTSADTDDALQELFDDEDFDNAMGEAHDEADRELDIADLHALDGVDDEEAPDEVDATVRLGGFRPENRLADDDRPSMNALVNDDAGVDDDDLADDVLADGGALVDEAHADEDCAGVDDDFLVDDGSSANETLAADDVTVDVANPESDAPAEESPVGDSDVEAEFDRNSIATADDIDAVLDFVPSDETSQPIAPVLDRDDTDDVERASMDVAEAGSAPDVEIDDGYELPAIVPATPDTDDDHDKPLGVTSRVPLVSPQIEPLRPDIADDPGDDEVSVEILEELRRADIDGPIVKMAPQDDTGAARRRPRRSKDYDPAPVPIPAQVPRVLGRKPRVRKVTRVVRHVDPWSVFKIALVANLVLYTIVLTSGVLLWNVAHGTGTVDNVERFFESFGWESFEFNGGQIYHSGWIAGLFGVIGLTGLAVLAATLFDLITDLVGGMRFTVLEEEVVETRISPMRRFVVRRPEPVAPPILRDQSGSMIREGIVDDTGANKRPSR